MEFVKVKNILSLILGFVECLLFGGLIHGWPSIVVVLQHEGVYEYLCHTEADAVNMSDNGLSGTFNQTESTPRDPEFIPNHHLTYYGAYSEFDLHSKWLQNSSHEPWNVTRDDLISPINDGNSKSLITSEIVNCASRNRMFGLAYTIAILVMMMANIIQGKLFDVFGMRVLRIIASIIFVPGALFMAFANNERSWMIFPGLIMLGTSGMSILITNTHLSILARGHKSTVSTLYSGAVDCSILVFLLIKVSWEHGVTRKMALGLLALSWLIVIFDTFLLYPKFKVDWSWARVKESHPDAVKRVRVSVLRQGVPSVMECLRSSAYYLHCLWFSLLFLRVVTFTRFFHMWINDVTDHHPEKVSLMTSSFVYVCFCGIPFSILLGLTMDWCKRRLFTTTNNLMGHAFAAMPVLLFTTVMAIVLSISLLLPYEFTVYISFFFFVVFKASLLAVFFAYFNLVIPPEHYGVLMGLATACGGVMAIFQFPLMIWVERSSMGQWSVNLFMLAVCLVCLIHPINVSLRNRRKRPHSARDATYDAYNTTALKLLGNKSSNRN